MRRWIVAVGTVLVLASCSPVRNDVAIECEGESELTEEQCTRWGEQVLSEFPEVATTTARLVLTYRGGNSRCDADFFDPEGRVHAHESLVCPQI